MSRKNEPINHNESEILQQKGRILADFMRCPKSDKKMTILRLNKAKKSAFFAAKQNVSKSTSRTGQSLGPAGRPAAELKKVRYTDLENSTLRVQKGCRNTRHSRSALHKPESHRNWSH